MRSALLALAIVLLPACPKPEATSTADAGGPADAAPPADAAVTVPTTLNVTGKLRYPSSWNYVPGLKDPSGKSSAGFDVVIANLAIDTAPGAKELRDIVRFDQSPMKMSAPNPGTCKTTLTTNQAGDMIGVWIQEPGCDTYKLYSDKDMKSGFAGIAKGKLVASGKPIDVHFDLKPSDPAKK